MAYASDRPNQLKVAACVAAHRQRRIASALEGEATVYWAASFAELLDTAVAKGALVAIVDAVDAVGDTAASVADALVRVAPQASIILFATPEELATGAVLGAALTDLIVAGETDGKVFLQSVVLDTVKRRAATTVVKELAARLPQGLALFAEHAIRFPACSTVETLVEHLGIRRQTAAVWCRRANICRPEELLIWCRLLLTTLILERTSASVARLATDLDFASVVALRNQFKRYTGMTALEARDRGFEALLAQFDEWVLGGPERRESRAGVVELISSS